VSYGESVPGGASQAPVFGFQLRLHARGCAAQTGGSVRSPPDAGPSGVKIWYGGAGAGVGSAAAGMAVANETRTAGTALAQLTVGVGGVPLLLDAGHPALLHDDP